MINQLKKLINEKKNETVSSLVNLNSESVASYRYMQGYVHGLDAVFSFIKQLEAAEKELDNE